MNCMRLGAIVIALILVTSIAYAVDDTSNSQTKRYFVILQDNADQQFLENYGNIIHHFRIMNAVAIELTPEALEQFELNPNIKSIEEDQIFYLPEEETKSVPHTATIVSTLNETPLASQSTEQGEQWNLGEAGINAQAAWETFGVDGEGVKIAIIDTGININLPELAGRSLGSYSLEGDTADNYNHGTKLASAILADGPQIKGIAPKALYYNIKMTDDWSFMWTDFLAAFEWALLNTDADIIYTGPAINAEFYAEPILRSNYATGRLFVAQSYAILGRDASYPARYAAVIGVGGYENTQPPTLLPQNGNEVEVVAPGKDVPVIDKEGNITTKTGIDVAAAQVAGALALMIDYNRSNVNGYSNSAIWETLNQSAIDLWLGNPKAGGGKVDANAALTWLANNWFLEYEVNYLEPDSGDRGGRPIYYKGQEMQYSVTVTNHSDQIINSKTIADLNIVSKQTINGTEHEFFTVIPELLASETQTQTVGPYAISIPTETTTGYYNTQITMKKNRDIPQDFWLPPFNYVAIIKDDDTAGIFKVADEPVPPVRFCSDSDGGVDPFVFGTCTDSRGTSVADKSTLFGGKSYVMEAFCLTPEMREHCKLFNGEEYCDELPNECYSLPLIPSTALAWTYFDYDEELFCPNGSYNGVCVPNIAAFKCVDELHFGFQNERYQWSQTEYCNGKCTDGICTKLSGTCTGTQAWQNRCIYFDQAHGGPSDWLQYCRVQWNGAPKGAWTNQKECANGCLNGECVEGTAALSESETGADALEGDSARQPDENMVDENFAQPDENVSDENISDENVLETNSAEPPLQALGAPELEAEPEPEPPANPPVQNTGSSGGSGGGGSYYSSTKPLSNTEPSEESKVVEVRALNIVENQRLKEKGAINAEKNNRKVQLNKKQNNTGIQSEPQTIESNVQATDFATLAHNALNTALVGLATVTVFIVKLVFK